MTRWSHGAAQGLAGLAVLASGLGLAACGSPEARASDAAGVTAMSAASPTSPTSTIPAGSGRPSPVGSPTGGYLPQYERPYRSLQELRDASPLIVVADATATSHVERVHGFAFTVRAFTVVEALKGRAPRQIPVRELGTSTGPWATASSGRYVLFVQPFEFERGVQYEHQFTAVGGPVGVYTVAGDTATATLAEPDRGGAPGVVTLDELRRNP